MRRLTVEDFWARVDRPDYWSCWTWTGPLNNKGYGRFGNSGYAHRIAYEMVVGPIPEGLELDHLCRTPACINPAHLDPVTHAENMRRAEAAGAQVNAAKTHCKQGHPYDEKNTIAMQRGRRDCRECARRRKREYRARQRRAAA